MQIICTSHQTDNHVSMSLLIFYRPDACRDAQLLKSINPAMTVSDFAFCTAKASIFQAVLQCHSCHWQNV